MFSHPGVRLCPNTFINYFVLRTSFIRFMDSSGLRVRSYPSDWPHFGRRRFLTLIDSLDAHPASQPGSICENGFFRVVDSSLRIFRMPTELLMHVYLYYCTQTNDCFLKYILDASGVAALWYRRHARSVTPFARRRGICLPAVGWLLKCIGARSRVLAWHCIATPAYT